MFSSNRVVLRRLRFADRFDGGFRYALVNGHPVNEIRAGLTFAFDVAGAAIKPGVTFGN
jgi:hypothetical protein